MGNVVAETVGSRLYFLACVACCILVDTSWLPRLYAASITFRGLREHDPRQQKAAVAFALLVS
jgi:hypothetical protein